MILSKSNLMPQFHLGLVYLTMGKKGANADGRFHEGIL
jgi:hypothetical protein